MLPKISRLTPLKLISITSVLQLTKLFKVSLIIGSQMAFFSASNIFSPMVGIFGGLASGICVGILQTIFKLLTGLSLGVPLIGYHIPHIFASAYWLSESKLFRISVPIISFFLFICHPIGSQAYSYACLWFIPIIIGLFLHKYIFFRALGSTFTAHSIGSVIWLYFLNMTPEAWIALIPIALLERLIFASGMVIVYYGVNKIKSYSQNKILVNFFNREKVNNLI